jgi:hypothetical protein
LWVLERLYRIGVLDYYGVKARKGGGWRVDGIALRGCQTWWFGGGEVDGD